MAYNDRDITTVLRLYQAHNRRDVDAWADAFRADAVWTNVPTGEEYIGPEGPRELSGVEHPVPRRAVRRPQGARRRRRGGGLVLAEFTGDGVNTGPLPTPVGELPQTGRRVAVRFCDAHEVADGLITRTDRYWDQASAAAQLGA